MGERAVKNEESHSTVELIIDSLHTIGNFSITFGSATTIRALQLSFWVAIASDGRLITSLPTSPLLLLFPLTQLFVLLKKEFTKPQDQGKKPDIDRTQCHLQVIQGALDPPSFTFWLSQ